MKSDPVSDRGILSPCKEACLDNVHHINQMAP
jgi:hypothetical protein